MERGRSIVYVVVSAALAACGDTATPGDGGLDAGDAQVDVRPERVVLDVVHDAERDAFSADASLDARAGTCGVPVRGTLHLPTDSSPSNRPADLYGDSRIHTASCAPQGVADGPEDVYAFHLDERSLVEFDATLHPGSAAPMQLVVSLRRVCDDAATELACGGLAPPSTTNGMLKSATATELEPGDYYAVVDVAGYGIGGAYDYAFSARPVSTLPTSCAAARAIGANATLMAEAVSEMVSESESCVAAGNPLPARFYSLTVPPGQDLHASINAGAAGALTLVLARGCHAVDCFATPTTVGPTGTEVHWLNTSDQWVPVTIAVLGQPANMVQTYDLFTLSLGASGNTSCATPTQITMDQTFVEDSRTAPDHVNACSDGLLLEHLLYYLATIPPGTIFGIVPRDPSEQLSYIRTTRCPLPPPCASDELVPAGGRFVYNQGAAATSVPFALSSIGGTGINFDTLFAPGPGNLTCGTPQLAPVGLGQTIYIVPSPAPADSPCGSLPNALFYRAFVPAHGRLSVHVAPKAAGMIQPTVSIFAGCTASDACIRPPPATVGFAGDSASFDNDTDGMTDVYFAVEAPTTAVTPVQLDVGIEVNALVETHIATACDDLSGVAPFALDNPPNAPQPYDDVATSPQTLPFAFPYFGESEMAFAAYSNGLIQLLPLPTSPTVSPGSTYTNMSLPSPAAPSRALAPFWADLVASMADGGTASIAGNLVEADPVSGIDRHYTVQWSHWGFFSERNADMTYQVKLFPTGAIEFHYCALQPGVSAGSLTDGRSATVGMQDASGAVGVLHAFQQPGAISTASAIRFAP